MTGIRSVLTLVILACFCLRGAALAQEGADQQPVQDQPAQEERPEGIEIGLSTDRIAITSDFSGADLTIFGALDNPDPLISRRGRYDVIVVLEGPARPVVVWRKDRVLGVWMNTESETFTNVPVSYSIASTRMLQDISVPENYRRLALGVNYLYLQPADRTERPATIEEFTAAIRDRKRATGLYSERVGGVQFLSQTLFRATVRLAPNVPVGTHRARAFLFRNGVFVKETSTQLAILKSGFEQTVHETAQQQSLLYGLFAVALAMLTGWLGRVVFRKD
jgi:uncharacterized protein (TIGR02186 family)